MVEAAGVEPASKAATERPLRAYSVNLASHHISPTDGLFVTLAQSISHAFGFEHSAAPAFVISARLVVKAFHPAAGSLLFFRQRERTRYRSRLCFPADL